MYADRHNIGGRHAVRCTSHARTLRAVRDVPIRGDGIRLGQLLKLAGVADSGGDARAMLEAGGVTVNGQPESRRGRQLSPGDVVSAGGEDLRVV